MKKLGFIAIVVATICFVSCEKEDIDPTSNEAIGSDPDSRTNTLYFSSWEQHSAFIQSLSNFLYPTSPESNMQPPVINQNFEPSNEQLSELRSRANSGEFLASFINKHKEKYEALQKKFPSLSEIKSVYSLYVNLLELNDKDEWKEAASTYPDFFFQGDQGLLLLKHTDLVSSMINLDMVYKVGTELVHYTSNSAELFDENNYILGHQGVKLGKPKKTVSYSDGTKAYAIKYDNYFYWGSGLRLRLIGKKDVVFEPPVCGFWRNYGQTEAYTQIMSNGVFVGYPAETIHTFIENTVNLAKESAVHHNSTWGSAGGELGCASSSGGHGMQGDVIYRPTANWNWLGHTATW